MPIYAYRCNTCGFQKDVLQKFSDAPLTVCPSCEKDTFGKQVTAPAFQLKGTGWYVTDFRDNGRKPAGNAASGGTDASKAAGNDVAMVIRPRLAPPRRATRRLPVRLPRRGRRQVGPRRNLLRQVALPDGACRCRHAGMRPALRLHRFRWQGVAVAFPDGASAGRRSRIA